MSENQKKQLEDLLLDDSFILFIKGLASKEEEVYWQNWQRQNANRQLLVKHARELVQFTENKLGRVPDPLVELHKFENSAQKSSTFEKRRDQINRYRPGIHKNSFWLTTAAVFLVVIISVGLFQFMDMGLEKELSNIAKTSTTTISEYETGFGEKASLRLTDGSRIILNANSHLSYSWSGSETNAQKINIHLQGEAWFDIKPSTGPTSRLFRVHTNDGIVEVTGTIFAVQTSSMGSRAVLKEGEIRILPQVSSDQPEISAVIRPGEMAQFFVNNDQINIKKVNPELYTSWIRDIWTFDQTPLSEIGARMEMVFGVEVSITPNSLSTKTLSGTIRSANLQLIKEGLSEALQVQVTQVDNKIIIGPV